MPIGADLFADPPKPVDVEPVAKTAWSFRCINEERGTFLTPGDAMTAEQALDYCRKKFGPKVQRVS